MTSPPETSSEQRYTEANDSRVRINQLRSSLGRFFVDKQPLIDLLCIAATAQEPLLLVGPPGTAKSELVLKFKDALGVPDDEFFEYTLTRLTKPSEIVGPLDHNQLRQGRYVRRTHGKLPHATLAFLSEIFQANSAILNVLLRILQEKKVDQDGATTPVKRHVLFAATNDVPEHGELSALKERFVLKAECLPVQNEHFDALIESGMRAEVDRALHQQPWAEGQCSLEDFEKANRYLTAMFARTGGSNDRAGFFPDDLFREYQQLVKTLVRDDRIFVSDRKLVKMYKLLRVRAWLFGDGIVSRDDLGLLAYLGDTVDEISILREKVPLLLGMG